MPEHDDVLMDRIAATLRAPAGPDAGADRRVMDAVRLQPQHATGSIKRFTAWLLRPQPLRVAPLGALAAAAAVVALWLVVPSTDRMAAPGPAAAQPVQFVLIAPEASTVTVVGDFNDWDPTATPLAAARTGGVWTTTVMLAPGRHRYAFLVDATRWIADPSAPPAGDDDFGEPSSALTVAS